MAFACFAPDRHIGNWQLRGRFGDLISLQVGEKEIDNAIEARAVGAKTIQTISWAISPGFQVPKVSSGFGRCWLDLRQDLQCPLPSDGSEGQWVWDPFLASSQTLTAVVVDASWASSLGLPFKHLSQNGDLLFDGAVCWSACACHHESAHRRLDRVGVCVCG